MPTTKRRISTNPDLADLDSKDRLILCAAELFQAKSYDGVTIRDIMQAAEVTQPAIYYHFKNKDGLFLAALLSILQELDEEFQQAIAQRGFANQLQALAKVFTRPPAPNLPMLVRNLDQRVVVNSKNSADGIAMSEARSAYLFVNQLWPRALENSLREARRHSEIQVLNSQFMAHYLLTLLTTYPHSPYNRLTITAPEYSTQTLLNYLSDTLKVINLNAQI